MGNLLGIICMFLNGFVTLTPHRIALTCATHVIKRFHLPPSTVPLFLHKIHHPMELANFFSTALAFGVSFINEWFFGNQLIIKRYLLFISIWVTFVSTIISYLTFVTGGDRGRFKYFFSSIILMTFTNGLASNFGFAINPNCTMYGAGITTSSFVTFIVHEIYHYFYNLYAWKDYSYNLVILHYSLSMYSLAVTGAIWTWVQLNEIMNDDKREWGNNSGDRRREARYISQGIKVKEYVIDASVTPTQDTEEKGALYGIGDKQITVERRNGGDTENTVPQDYIRFKHERTNKNAFTLSSVIHNGVELKFSDPLPTSVTAVYVYYHNDDNTTRQFPLIVCVKIDTNTWKYYKRGNVWKEERTLSGIDPENGTTAANAIRPELEKLKDRYEIKLEWINTGSGENGYKATAKSLQVKVEKKTESDQNVPQGFLSYKHSSGDSSATFKLGIIMHGDFYFYKIKEYNTSVAAVYVYYSDNDGNYEFPLIVCVKINEQNRTYYTRGDGWDEDKSIIDDPDQASVKEQLKTSLEKFKDKYEIRLEWITIGTSYKANAKGTTVTVTKGDASKVPTGYVAYSHEPGAQLTNVKFKHNGNDIKLRGVKDSITINQGKKVWIFYQKDKQGNAKLETPLLLYYQKSMGSDNNKWYGKGMKWEKDMDLDNVDASTGLTASNNDKIASKFESILLQGKFKELIHFYNLTHWSPILMLTFSLGTIYAFYPTTIPYSLIDPERAEKIDLWIVVVCAVPNLGLAILDLEQVDMGPGKKWVEDQGGPDGNTAVHRNYYHYVWLAGIPYIISLHVFISTVHFPDGFIGRHVKDNPFLVGLFGITLNTSQKLMEFTALGGGAVQSHDGFVGSISQFNVLLMLSLSVFTIAPCRCFYTDANSNISTQFSYSHYSHSPWRPILLVSSIGFEPIPNFDIYQPI